MGFCTRRTASSQSSLSLLSTLSVKSKWLFVHEIYLFLSRPNPAQLNAMKRMKRTFQAFQGHRSLHNCTVHDSLLPQNSSIQQKIERFAVKGIVMVANIGACIVISMSVEKYIPTGSMRIMVGLGISVYRGMLPSESIPILLRGFNEKIKNLNGHDGGSGSNLGKSNGNSMKSGGGGGGSSKTTVDPRYQYNSFRRPVPVNCGDMSDVATVEDVGGCIIMNIRKLGLPRESMMFNECSHSYWERKNKYSLIPSKIIML